MIVCYLLHTGMCRTAAEALDFYGIGLGFRLVSGLGVRGLHELELQTRSVLQKICVARLRRPWMSMVLV